MSNIPVANREIIYKNFNSSNAPNAKRLRLIHFNDVYNIEGVRDEPVGGGARFKTVLDELTKPKQSVVLFSGDAVSPSMRKFSIYFYCL